jgi:hypothetical protein
MAEKGTTQRAIGNKFQHNALKKTNKVIPKRKCKALFYYKPIYHK